MLGTVVTQILSKALYGAEPLFESIVIDYYYCYGVHPSQTSPGITPAFNGKHPNLSRLAVTLSQSLAVTLSQSLAVTLFAQSRCHTVTQSRCHTVCTKRLAWSVKLKRGRAIIWYKLRHEYSDTHSSDV